MNKLITGYMGSGKTAELIKKHDNVVSLICTPDFCYTGTITSRNGSEAKSHKIEDLYDVLSSFVGFGSKDMLPIFVDEYQFLTQEEIDILLAIPNPKYFYGLRYDYLGNEFENYVKLEKHCDSVEFLEQPECTFCHDKAAIDTLYKNRKRISDQYCNELKTQDSVKYVAMCKTCSEKHMRD